MLAEYEVTKTFEHIFDGEKHLAFHDLRKVREYVDARLAVSRSHAQQMGIPPSERRNAGVYDSAEDMFGSLEGFYEALFSLRLKALGSTLQNFFVTVGLTVFGTGVFLLALSEFGTSSGLQLAGNILASFLIAFVVGGLLALIFMMTIGNFGVHVSTAILRRQGRDKMAEAWERLLLEGW